MKIFKFFKQKATKKTVFYSVLALIILSAVTVNVLLDLLTQKKTLFIDTTAEGLYTVSDGMKAEMDKVTAPVKFTFCSEPDRLLENYESRYTYLMAMKLANMYDNITVECVDSLTHPEKLDKYRTTSATGIGVYDLVISSGLRYRIMRSGNFWTKDENEDYYAFNGEYKAACAILSITSTESPLVCFTTGHGEKYYNPNDVENSNADFEEFYNLLELAGLTVGYVNLDTEDIPEDCVMLIINGATVDYTSPVEDIYKKNATSPIEKIDRFLANDKSLFISRDPFVELPALEEYLVEWGLAFGDERIQTSNTSEGQRLFTKYVTEDEDEIGYSLFSDVASLTTAPKVVTENNSQIRLLWEDAKHSSPEKYVSPGLTIMASAVLRSGDNTVPYTADGVQNPIDKYGETVYETNYADYCGNYPLAAVSVRSEYIGVNYYYSYVFAVGTTSMLTNEYLGVNSYANNDFFFTTARTLTRTDMYADDSLGAINLNNSDTYGGKILQSSEMSEEKEEVYKKTKLVRTYFGVTTSTKVWWTIFLAVLPVLVLPTLCVVVTLRRKHK